MDLFCFRDPVGNFGDDLNFWMWPKLLPNFLNFKGDIRCSQEIFLGIGTVLNNLVPEEPRKIVFGSGVGYGIAPNVLSDAWEIYCVRGPLSAEKLKLPKESWITDGAALLSLLSHPIVPIIEKKTSFMPHRKSSECGDWKTLCEEIGINYISPRYSVETCLQEIRSSSLLITEAMHGAIVADLFRIPWIPIKSYSHILSFKWVDWCQSLSMNYKPVSIPSLWRREYFADMEKWYYGWENSTYMKLRLKMHKKIGALWSDLTISHFKDKISNVLYKLSIDDAMLSDDRVLSQAVEKMEAKLFDLKKKYHLG